MMRFSPVISVVVLMLAANGLGDDWPQWRGPNRDGKSAETLLLKKWPAAGPKLLWSAEGLGKGFASVAVADGVVYATGMKEATRGTQKGQTGVLFAFDLEGNPKWLAPYGREWDGQHPGSRCIPTVDGELVYVMSGRGTLACFDAKTGEKSGHWTS